MRIAVLIFIYIQVLGCSEKRQPLGGSLDPRDLNINDAVSFEKVQGSIDKTQRHPISMDDGIYPQATTLQLSTPRIFQRAAYPHFNYELYYYYTGADEQVRVVFHSWKRRQSMCRDIACMMKYNDPDSIKAHATLAQLKYDQLTQQYSGLLGTPIHIECHDWSAPGTSFRNSMRWRSQNGVGAYLYAFGTSDEGMNAINLAVYRD